MRKSIRAAAWALTIAALAAGSPEPALAGGAPRGNHGPKTTKPKHKKTASKKTHGKTAHAKKTTKGKKTRTSAGELEATARLIEALAKGVAKSDPALAGELKKLKSRSGR